MIVVGCCCCCCALGLCYFYHIRQSQGRRAAAANQVIPFAARPEFRRASALAAAGWPPPFLHPHVVLVHDPRTLVDPPPSFPPLVALSANPKPTPTNTVQVAAPPIAGSSLFNAPPPPPTYPGALASINGDDDVALIQPDWGSEPPSYPSQQRQQPPVYPQ